MKNKLIPSKVHCQGCFGRRDHLKSKQKQKKKDGDENGKIICQNFVDFVLNFKNGKFVFFNCFESIKILIFFRF
jgi:hypothetical protein